MTYRFVTHAEDSALSELLRIYHASFEEASREPDERLIQELKGQYKLPFRFLVVEEQGVHGFARFCATPNFGFLIHIAVDESSRGRGVGSVLLRRVVQELQPLPVVVEIDREGPVRRWYEREGFSPISETYIQPALHPHTSAVSYALFAKGSLGMPSEELIADFYRTVWEISEDHPFVLEAWRGIVR